MHWTFKICWYQVTIFWAEIRKTWGYEPETGTRFKIPVPMIYIREYWLYDLASLEPDPDDISF